VTVIKIGNYGQAAADAATNAGELACGNRPRSDRRLTTVSDGLADTTCTACRRQLGIDQQADDQARLAALFALAIMLGLRPGELRALRWDHVDLDNGVIYVWRSTRRDGDTKTPKSRRSLILPKRAIQALRAHKKRQAAERLAAGEAWQDHGLVFCHEAGRPYTRDSLNWRFGKVTQLAGVGHWHAHEARHTAVSIMKRQQRNADPRDHRHHGSQVHPRHRDGLPARHCAGHPRWRVSHGSRLRRDRRSVVTWLVTSVRTEVRKTSGAMEIRTPDLLHAMNHSHLR
jgi:integrase